MADAASSTSDADADVPCADTASHADGGENIDLLRLHYEHESKRLDVASETVRHKAETAVEIMRLAVSSTEEGEGWKAEQHINDKLLAAAQAYLLEYLRCD